MGTLEDGGEGFTFLKFSRPSSELAALAFPPLFTQIRSSSMSLVPILVPTEICESNWPWISPISKRAAFAGKLAKTATATASGLSSVFNGGFVIILVMVFLARLRLLLLGILG